VGTTTASILCLAPSQVVADSRSPTLRKSSPTASVGDGIWDIHALKEADYRFVIKGSRLAELCRRQGIPAREVSDFPRNGHYHTV
jgi:2-hydroxy-3-keto-5-methylthiopentenyl-1-phosphate phosphatase